MQLDPGRAHLVVNRFDARHHHARAEIEWHLGVPTAAVIPFDHRGVQRAVAEQRSVVLDASSRAGRALLGLSERLYQDKLRLPPEAHRYRPEPWWQRWASHLTDRAKRPARPARPAARTPAPLTGDPIAVAQVADADTPW